MVEWRSAARTSLIGREREIGALRELLSRAHSQLVTLTGVGGGGKTRLAMAITAEVQDAFGGVVHWVSLAPVAEPALVPQAVASALGVIETAGTPLIESISTRLAVGRCLLVLDNCEHLLDACAELVEHLLAMCRDLTILATSREPLMVADEQQWRVPPLSVPDPGDPASPDRLASSPAVRLFVERAQAVVPAFSLTSANAEGVAEVCIRLDGIPLALELAAARVRVLSVDQILARLDDAFRLLTGGSRAAPTRQQTLQATLDWSYNLLTEPERAFFRRVAVFAGSFDLAAVEVVCEGVDALDLVTRLTDKSLFIVEADGEVARYRLLEPVRQYAGRHLSENGGFEDARARHAACYLALAERAAQELCGRAQVEWLARLDRDVDNLRAALHWAVECDGGENLTRAAVALTPYWEVRGSMSEGQRWLEAALDRQYPPLVPAMRAEVLVASGRLAYWQADLERATERLQESLTLTRDLDDRQVAAHALTWLGAVQGRRREFAEAVSLIEKGFALHEALGDEHGTAWALFVWGVASGNAGDWPAANRLLGESLQRYRALGDVRSIAITSVMAGTAATISEDFRWAKDLVREGLIGLRKVGDRGYMLSGLLTLAWTQARLGEPDRAARLLGAADALRQAIGATLAPVNRHTYESTLNIIRPRLSEAQIAAAITDGRRMTLDEAIEDAMHAGASWPAPPAREASSTVTPVETLTRREREIVPLLVRGATDREIAEALSIAISTVGVHVHHILGKLGLNSRWQVADWAVANGLAPEPAD